MKLQWILGGAIALSMVSCGGEKTENKEHSDKSEVEFFSSLSTEMDSISYALGVNISEGFKKQKVTGISADKMAKGFNDFIAGSATMNGSECMNTIQGFMMNHQMKVQDTLSPEVMYEASLLDSVSYALGVNVSESFKNQGVDGLNGTLLAKGYADFSKGNPVIDGVSALNVLQAFMTKQQALKAEASKLEAAPMIAEGEAFLAENAKRPEVTTLPSGLQYEIVKEGNGEKPTMMNSVLAHYHGTLINGTVFDSSVDRGEPTEFPVGGVIAGWTEALQLMPVGSKWKLYVPYNLAYGERGAGANIKPYSTLIFDVELLKITK